MTQMSWSSSGGNSQQAALFIDIHHKCFLDLGKSDLFG